MIIQRVLFQKIWFWLIWWVQLRAAANLNYRSVRERLETRERHKTDEDPAEQENDANAMPASGASQVDANHNAPRSDGAQTNTDARSNELIVSTQISEVLKAAENIADAHGEKLENTSARELILLMRQLTF